MTRYLTPVSNVTSTRRSCYALTLGAAVVLTGCGGGSSTDLDQRIDDARMHINESEFPTSFMCSSNPSYCTDEPVATAPQSVALVNQALKGAPKVMPQPASAT